MMSMERMTQSGQVSLFRNQRRPKHQAVAKMDHSTTLSSTPKKRKVHLVVVKGLKQKHRKKSVSLVETSIHRKASTYMPLDLYWFVRASYEKKHTIKIIS